MESAVSTLSEMLPERKGAQSPRIDDRAKGIYEESAVCRIVMKNHGYSLEPASKSVIGEMSLMILVNKVEVATLLCLNRQHEDLALGFLYGEGLINSFDEVVDISCDHVAGAVYVTLADSVTVKRHSSLRSVTAGCGKCFTDISLQEPDASKRVKRQAVFPLDELLVQM